MLGSIKSKINKDKNGENMHHLKLTEVVLVHCNIKESDYRQDSRVLYIFVPNKSFDRLLDTSPNNYIILRYSNSEFSYIEVWFKIQNVQVQCG